MELPIGYDIFREVIENKLDFVDKSLFIKEVIDDRTTKAVVITRPRRFGKTLNLSMLHHFLASEAYGLPTAGLFANLKIMQAGDEYAQHCGHYPVIFITFKDVKNQNYTGAYHSLCKLMSRVYWEHRHLLTSSQLTAHQKNVFESVLEERATEASLQTSLLDLTQALFVHHGVKPWLLVDEYDLPIQASYVNHYYTEMIHLLRTLFGHVLKSNPYLYKAVITGILRVAKESLFSGVNNLKVYSLLQTKYSTQFGFTEEEVELLCQKGHLEDKLVEIKEWYNGYQAGEVTLYNPWSIVNYIEERSEPKPYWINTSDNQIIRNLLVRSSQEFKERFEVLLQGNTIERFIDENTVFGDLHVNESAAWSLLFMAGYLKIISHERTSDGLRCQLAIPNQEVRDLYQQIIKQWLANGHGIEWYNSFLDHLLEGHLEAFARDLKHVMEQTVSSHDTAPDPEAFYHGLMIGLTASLYRNQNYEIQSNRESGYGRYDYLIFSHDKNKPTILLEFKKVASIKDPDKLTIHLEEAAQAALTQIDQRAYLSEVKKRGATRILKVGLAFCGKRFKIKSI